MAVLAAGAFIAGFLLYVAIGVLLAPLGVGKWLLSKTEV